MAPRVPRVVSTNEHRSDGPKPAPSEPPPALDAAFERIRASSVHPLRRAFHARLLEASVELADRLPDDSLGEVVAAPTHVDALLEALLRGEALELFLRDDPLRAARARGLSARRALLNAEGGMLSGQEAADRLGVTRQAVDKRRRAGSLLAVEIGRRGFLYPSWQFGEGGVLFGFASVLGELAERGPFPPWTLFGFFLNGASRLGGRTPIAALRAGEIEAVRRAARAFASHGAS